MNQPAFQHYQHTFASHIREPGAKPMPEGASVRGMEVYAEIVFNNFESTLAACFPVCKEILGEASWEQLVRAFLAQHACSTPLFHQIPEEFLNWLQSASETDLPGFFLSLAHYEWVELAVGIADIAATPYVADGDLLAGQPVLAPSLALLQYPFAVQRISPHYKPTQPDPEATYLLVFRNNADKVQFIEINAMTAQLVHLLQRGGFSGRAALINLAAEIGFDGDAMLAHGAELLHDLHRQGVLLGTLPVANGPQ